VQGIQENMILKDWRKLKIMFKFVFVRAPHAAGMNE
jgi:hypothetical protein